MAAFRLQREEQYKRLVAGVRRCAAAPWLRPAPPPLRAASLRLTPRLGSACLSSQQTGDLGSTSARLDEEGARTTAAMRAAVASAQADVVGLLVGMVTKVQ